MIVMALPLDLKLVPLFVKRVDFRELACVTLDLCVGLIHVVNVLSFVLFVLNFVPFELFEPSADRIDRFVEDFTHLSAYLVVENSWGDHVEGVGRNGVESYTLCETLLEVIH